MSDEQQQHQPVPVPVQEQTAEGNRWGDPISDERKEKLRKLAKQQQAWVALSEDQRKGQDSFFKGVHLTGADVFWLAIRALAGLDSTPDALEAAAVRLRMTEREVRFALDLSALHLEGTDLSAAQLTGAVLRGAQLDGAFLIGAQLDEAFLREAHLERANLRGVQLERVFLIEAHLERADLSEAHLDGANLRDAQLAGAVLRGAQLAGANLSGAELTGAYLRGAELTGAVLRGAQLERADLIVAQLERADLIAAQLERADLRGAQLDGANLRDAQLAGAYLNGASFDKTSRLNGASLSGAVLDQVIFDNTNLTVVEWGLVQRLGDESAARKVKGLAKKAIAYHAAARAYRALAVALRAQGLGSDATRFHYRSELMARREHFFTIFARLFSRKFYTAPASLVRWLFSWLLGTFAGYGDQLGRLFLTYLVVVSAFAGLMFLVAGRAPSFDSIRDVFVLSVTSFHGRGVQPPGLHLTDALATLTAIEAFFGLAIEGIFIAAFTRRVTGN